MNSRSDIYQPSGRFRGTGISSRLLLASLILVTGGTVSTIAQPSSLQAIRGEFNDGYFDRVVERAPVEIRRARKSRDYATASEVAVLGARSLMQLEKYDEVPQLLDDAFSDAAKVKSNSRGLAAVHFCRAAFLRTRRDFQAAADFARKAFAAVPNDRKVETEYYLNIGRILYSAGYDLAAIIWLEKAEKLSEDNPRSAIQIEVLRYLSVTWWSKFDYAKALNYAKKTTDIATNSPFPFRYRLSLYDLARLLNVVGQKSKA
ncbi:MAG: hypothetical protein ACRD6X_19010, partial [Pyrinomonadaceae bacterium]